MCAKRVTLWFKRIQKTHMTLYAYFSWLIFFKWAFICINWLQSMSKILLFVWTYSFILCPTCNWYCTIGSFGGSQCDAGVSYMWFPTEEKQKNKWLKIFKNRCMIPGFRTRIIYDFLVIIQGSYMISLVSYKNRTKKSSMDSMKSYMILVWNQRNVNPGCNTVQNVSCKIV